MSYRYFVVIFAFSLVTLLALLIAVAAAYLARRDHASYPAALTRAGAAFTTTITLAALLTTTISTMIRG